MPDGLFERNDFRSSPRFVPQESLSMFLANDKASLVRGDIKDLSEVGARVLTPAALDRGQAVTIDVRSGYSYLFRAEARIVWRSDVESRRDSGIHEQGIFFTELSPFSRKLIRRLSGLAPGEAAPIGSAWGEFDGDLEALFPPGSNDDRFDLLSDPVLESPLYEEAAELTGNLGYFTTADILQMLEAARATGVLYVEGDDSGQIHLRDGRICGCFSRSLDEYQAAFRLIVADRGAFRFVPSAVRANLETGRTTTHLLLEAQLRLDNGR